MEKTVQQMFAKRRTNYTLGKDVTLSQEEITARIEAIVRESSVSFQYAVGTDYHCLWQCP